MRLALSSARVPAAWGAKLNLKNQPHAHGFALRLILLAICIACACALCYRRAAAQQQASIVAVDEAATRIAFTGGATQVDVVIKSGDVRRASIRLELLGTNDDVLTHSDACVSLTTGANVVRVPLKFDVRKLKPEEGARLAWYRVRASVN